MVACAVLSAFLPFQGYPGMGPGVVRTGGADLARSRRALLGRSGLDHETDGGDV